MKVIRLGMEDGMGEFFCGESKVSTSELKERVNVIIADLQEEGEEYGPALIWETLREKDLVTETDDTFECLDITI